MLLSDLVTRHARTLAIAVLACLPLLVLTPGAPGADPPAAREAVRLTGGTATPNPEPPSRPRLRRVTIALSGDILVHDNVWASAASAAGRTGASGFDFRPMLAPLRPALSAADLAICHLETPLAPAGGPYSGYPLFSAPPQVVDALDWVGYDACSTASNHSVDQGFAGITRTLDTLDRFGLAHTGSARSAAEARRIAMFDMHGITIAWLSYSYGTNGMPVDADKPWSVNLIDPGRIERDARAARRAGAEAVLVALHWGDEYSHAPSAFQRGLADLLTRHPDLTLVYGTHAHVVQPIARLNGTWVIFGLGDLLAGQGAAASARAAATPASVTLRQRGDGPVLVGRPTYRPTHIGFADPRGEFRVYDDRSPLASDDLDPTTRAELLASLAQTRSVVGRVGTP